MAVSPPFKTLPTWNNGYPQGRQLLQTLEEEQQQRRLQHTSHHKHELLLSVIKAESQECSCDDAIPVLEGKSNVQTDHETPHDAGDSENLLED
jgi:hypothetical protein